MVDVLLEALGLVAGGHQGAGLPGGAALLNPKKKVFKLHIKIRKKTYLKKQEKMNGQKMPRINMPEINGSGGLNYVLRVLPINQSNKGLCFSRKV